MGEERINVFAGMTDVGQAEELLNRFQCDHPNDQEGVEALLNDILDALMGSGEQLTGNADEFHNMAVNISKIKGESRDALDMVREGLKIHEANADLLADAIRYGYSCGEKDACAEWYRALGRIDRSRWTWRAFSFSVDYLMAEQDSSLVGKCSSEDIYALIKDYQEKLPDREDAWLCEFEFYTALNQKKKAVSALEAAMDQFNFCPRCWLRYAEAMIEDGDYEKAEPVIKKLRQNPKTVEAVNLSYVFYLDGECKMRRLLASDGYEEGEFDEKDVLKIYKDFQLALTTSGLRQSTKNNINAHLERLVKETGVDNIYF